MSDPATPPRVPRSNVLLYAEVTRPGGRPATRHRVRDLSAGGVRIDTASDLEPGSTVRVAIGALEGVSATVKWVAAGAAGLAFVQPVDPEKARMRAAIAPKVSDRPAPVAAARLVPKAGWAADLESPYRR